MDGSAWSHARASLMRSTNPKIYERKILLQFASCVLGKTVEQRQESAPNKFRANVIDAINIRREKNECAYGEALARNNQPLIHIGKMWPKIFKAPAISIAITQIWVHNNNNNNNSHNSSTNCTVSNGAQQTAAKANAMRNEKKTAFEMVLFKEIRQNDDKQKLLLLILFDIVVRACDAMSRLAPARSPPLCAARTQWKQ